jgi:hypothetical protein
MTGKPWPKKSVAAFKRRYPHEPTAAIAADLGISVAACYHMATRLCLKKTPAYLASPAAYHLRRGTKVGAGSRFQPGHVPANKGLRRPGWAPGRMAETQFKPGNSPHTTRAVGSYRLDKNGILQRKIGTAKGNNSKRWRGVLDWVVAGGESGPKARPMHPDWVRGLRDQCAAASVPFLFKQWGAWAPQELWDPRCRKPQCAIRLDGSFVGHDEVPQDVGGHRFAMVGKKLAGRLLDGVENNGYPEPS